LVRRPPRFPSALHICTCDQTIFAPYARIEAIGLYDHQNDPQENTNIAKLPANAALVERLMDQWRRGWQGAKPVTTQ
jgi:hypothetical protein